jgi:hypothetical protein
MNKVIACWTGLLVLSVSMPLQAADCPAAAAMFDDEKKFDSRKEAIERQQWLFLDYLTTGRSTNGRELLAVEQGRAQVRMDEMAELDKAVDSLPAGGPHMPAEGTSACEVATQAKEILYRQIEEREVEMQKYYGDGYLFILGCDLLAVNLLPLGNSANKPGSKVDSKTMVLMSESGLDPLIKAAKMKPADFEKLAGEMLRPSQLPAKTRYSYAALRCLRTYQGVGIKPLAAANEALAKCDSPDWTKLGRCVDEATQSAKR